MLLKKLCQYLMFLGICLIISLPLNSQFYNGSQMFFGKNRVQYEDRFWSYFRYPVFNVYYTLNGKNLAIFTARYAQEQIPLLEKKLDYSLNNNIQFIVFNNLSDLKQSNIGLISQEQYNIGGITHIVGTKIFLYYNGDHRDFERQIRAGITQILLEEMLYGQSITSMIKNTTLLALPEWYIQGLVSYISDEYNEEVENNVLDGILSGRYEKFNNLTGQDAVYAGHSIWNYIAYKYGENKLSDIIYMTKISRSVESGFLFVLGISFKSLLNDWINHYDKLYYDDNRERTMPDVQPVAKRTKKVQVYSNVKLSNDGNYAAWTTNDIGRYKVWIYDINKNKTRPILRYGYRLDDKTDLTFPILAWHPSSKILSIILERKNKIYLYYYTLETKKFNKIRLFDFEKILDFSYSDDGRLIVLSGVQNGQTDIFVFNPASQTYEQITKDLWDDINPRFVSGSSEIIFCSNRINDTVIFQNDNFIAEQDKLPFSPYTDVFVYNYKTKNPVLRRLTQTAEANECYPSTYNKNYFSYLSNENGIYNQYLGRFDSTVAFIDTVIHYRYFSVTAPVTDFKRNIIEQDINPKTGKVSYIIFHNGKYKIYIDTIENVNTFKKIKLKESPAVKFKNEIKRKNLLKDSLTEEKFALKQSHKRFELVKQDKIPKDTNKINIDNYLFGKPPNDNVFGNDSVKINLNVKNNNDILKKLNTGHFKVHKARNYDVEYMINQMISQIDFSFLNNTYQPFSGGGFPIYINAGFNVFFSVGITDLLEDYRLTGGVRLSGTLDNNEYFLSYENLKRRLDQQVVFHRKVTNDASDFLVIKDFTHEVHYILKYPFDEVIAVKSTVLLRNDKRVYLSTDDNNLKKPDIISNWFGAKAELIYDNTREKGLNLFNGTRSKFFAEYYKQFEEGNSSMYILGIDFRNYLKIHKSFIWANRFAASTSFGPRKLIYYMGGVDNWLFPKFNTAINISTENNYAYQTLATNMRGFHQNIRNGNNFAVINSELRLPVFKYFSDKPLKSDFLENFQIIGFGDIGTAWTGSSPYSDNNSLFTQVIEDGSIKITLKNQKEPIVGGFGVGLRSRILGYFLRADWAWGVEDRTVLPSVFYLSLSLDF